MLSITNTNSTMASFQQLNLFGNIFEIPLEYSDLKPVGLGSYGFVCSAKSAHLLNAVALKKIFQPFQSSSHAKGVYREIRLLKTLKHDNIIHLIDAFISPSNDVYLVTDLLDTDLQRLIESQSIDLGVVSFLLYQILRGLKFLHSANVIHRDLKPSNILVNENCDLKICDFGLARISEPQMTGYVATRYFRAPEILLSWEKYGTPVDIWSVGCIFAEMLSGKTLFPGNDQVHQILLITELLGTPPPSFIDSIKHEITRKYLASIPSRPPIPLKNEFPNIPHQAIDLLQRMLVYDEKQRITAAQALEHEFLETFHDPSDEPEAEAKFDWDCVSANLPVDKWRELVKTEINELFMRGSI